MANSLGKGGTAAKKDKKTRIISKGKLVKLRARKNKDGSESLYLDFTYQNHRKYEFLKFKLLPLDGDRFQKALLKVQNDEAEKHAEQERSKKEKELLNEEYGFTKKYDLNGSFLDYFQSLINDRKKNKSNYENWLSASKHLLSYCGKNKPGFKDVNESFVKGFKEHLLQVKKASGKKLSANSAHSYFNKFRAALNQAFIDGIIPENVALRVKQIPADEPDREFLTREEFSLLVDTDCEMLMLKRAFIFSVLTGIRWSDIVKLKWGDIKKLSEEQWIINFKQQKTGSREYLPIKSSAKNYLGEEGEPDEKVFIGLKYSAWNNLKLAQWVMKAGIKKNITFHCARHTHAFFLLEKGVPIYDVSKLLGHKNIKTTQVYARIMDQSKIEALKAIPDIELNDYPQSVT